ncbi:NAD kinase [Nakamurella sp. YIM 132087]|uniref:NAD kinase n=1 Tax=Nakamurella alba TaxID=2665158 RepID=A0A7K1FR47_9ACTN|nr:NAD kinase [Nakamurella alba]MTD16617.1 NAD kinase [Nakamurella alba]
MTRRVLLVAHTGRADVAAIAHKVWERLDAEGIGLVGLADESAELELTALQENGRAAEVEVVLALGGDGTLLRAAEAARPLGVPVLGVNLGRVGFLAEADVDTLDEAVESIIHRHYLQPGGVTVRMTVDISVEFEGEIIERCWALNEVSVEKATRERILDVVVEVDGRGVSAFGCDGVLCATPTGSTAYAFSAGGPIIWPEVEALLVIPSNAHALFARPLVVSPESTVTVHLDPDGHGAILACDGRRIHEVPSGARVHVRRGDRPVTMIRLGDQPFSDRLVRKFALPVHGWRQQRH